ncbi:MAG: glycosyltransferase family 39 protein [Acidobacteriota bacterium]|nr:glycosyltransferase family 39 protein [Acidobacteriota bacterium]
MTKDESKIQNPRPKIVWILFAFVIVFVYFFALGSIPLFGPDEPRYAQVAREMFERNDWITPTLGGYKWFEKPALLYWLQIVSYKIFGVSEFAARFGSAVCGLGTIFSLWILGRKVQSSKFKVQSQLLANQTTIHDSRLTIHDFADWLFLISASSIGLLVFSRGASFDIVLTFTITVSLVSFFIFDQSTKKSLTTYHLPLAAFYFFIGVALLAKGLVGIVFPFAIVAFYFVLRRKMPDKMFIFSLFWGTILSLLVAAVWYVPVYLANGWTFVEEFFIQHQFQRYTSNKFQHPQPVWFFFLVLPLMTLPWLPFFLAAIWDFIKVQSLRFKTQSQENSLRPVVTSPIRTFAFAWLLVPLVFFSFSGSKLPGYILPALPAALVWTAEYVCRFVENNRTRKIALLSVAFATFAFVVIALQFFVADYARDQSVKTLIATAAAQGYSNEKILNFNNVSHNTEFYGAGRLVRDADGKQKRFLSVPEIVEELKRENAKGALVLAPLESFGQLTESDLIHGQVLGDNGELSIVSVETK